LALIDKGMGREEAYGVVQANAMKAWQEKKSFLSLLEAEAQIAAWLSKPELESLFDYDYYLRHIDSVFERLGLTGLRKIEEVKTEELAPRAL
jgi:adenylosuccinate lyase